MLPSFSIGLLLIFSWPGFQRYGPRGCDRNCFQGLKIFQVVGIASSFFFSWQLSHLRKKTGGLITKGVWKFSCNRFRDYFQSYFIPMHLNGEGDVKVEAFCFKWKNACLCKQEIVLRGLEVETISLHSGLFFLGSGKT